MAITPTQSGTPVDPNSGSKTPAVQTWVYAAVPNDTQANRESNQAVQLMKSGNPKAALELLMHALSLPKEDATDTAALQNRAGVAMNRLGDQKGAIEMFERAGTPPALYNEGVSLLKVAVAASGQTMESYDPKKLDPAQLKEALGFLAKAVSANREFFSQMAVDDADWGRLIENPAFRTVTGMRPLDELPVAQRRWTEQTKPPAESWATPTKTGGW